MRVPAPGSLLVEHPALPQPFARADTHGATIPLDALDEIDRTRVAAQLIAATSLLADFELWPGRWALRRAWVEETPDGARVRVPALPVSLSRLWSRLGGGDPAAEATRTAVLAEVGGLTGLDLLRVGEEGSEPGFFLDDVLARLLDEIGRPLDPVTARSLWMWRWSLPPLPDEGDTVLVAVPDDGVARRIGAAQWAAAVRRGVGATFEVATAGQPTTTVARRGEDAAIRVIAGSFDEGLLATRVDRDDGPSETEMMIGAFPEGWNPRSATIHDPARLTMHLAVVGVPPARRPRLIDGLIGRFDPFSSVDRRWLTSFATTLFSHRQPRRGGRYGEIVTVAALAPEGIPIDRALELAECEPHELDAAHEARAVLVRRGKVLLPGPVSLTVDPRHGEVATLFDEDDPRRCLHQALASGDTGKILIWARAQLNDLDATTVRSLLSGIAPGALGAGVQAVLVEACLSLADIHGARRALDGLNPELARPLESWLRVIDRPPDREIELPRPIDLRHAPRACAEVALLELRRALEWRPDAAAEPLEVIQRALSTLEGASRRWVEIRLAALTEVEKLDDPEWRRSVAGGHPELVGLLLFERSLRATFEKDFRLARRLLRRLMSGERSPGRMALMQVNLGYVEGEDGRHQLAEALTLGAYRLFQAAGFKHRGWDALYNLAVADIDQLRVDRAAARLDALAEFNDSLFVAVERTRLALAVGDLALFRSRLGELPGVEESSSTQIVEALSFLHGAATLLDGSPARAVALLRAGGEEGRAWSRLADVILGKPTAEPDSGSDGWGVLRAARLARRLRAGESVRGIFPRVDGDLDLKDAFAAALCRRIGVLPDWPDREARDHAASLLSKRGLEGWAARLRWDRGELERLLRGFSRLVRARRSVVLEPGAWDDTLAALGITGLVVQRIRDGGEILMVGEGDPGESSVRGQIEVVPLGVESVSGSGWRLLTDLLDLMYPTGGVIEEAGERPDVRIDGVSTAAVALRGEIRRAAAPTLTVLIQGETGSGKEVVAKEIHRLSGRAGELVSVNVAAVPAALLEAELFGTVKGAFTGADRSRRGLVAAAEGGTLFLDEVGDLDVALQVKLLRFLESGEVRPVGADRSRHLDVRVVCATHRNLDRRVRNGRFRQDLFYRIAVHRIRVPGLRERPEDIPVLRAIFEREAAQRHGFQVPSWTAAAERLLMNHRWPGNVRELKHTVEVAMARAGGQKLRPEHLPLNDDGPPVRGSWEGSLSGFKRRLLTEVLNRHRGNRSAAARELGISRQGLLYQIKKLGLTDL